MRWTWRVNDGRSGDRESGDPGDREIGRSGIREIGRSGIRDRGGLADQDQRAQNAQIRTREVGGDDHRARFPGSSAPGRNRMNTEGKPATERDIPRHTPAQFGKNVAKGVSLKKQHIIDAPTRRSRGYGSNSQPLGRLLLRRFAPRSGSRRLSRTPELPNSRTPELPVSRSPEPEL